MSTKAKVLEAVRDQDTALIGDIVEDSNGDICFVATTRIAMTSDFMTGIVNRIDEIKQSLKED